MNQLLKHINQDITNLPPHQLDDFISDILGVISISLKTKCLYVDFGDPHQTPHSVGSELVQHCFPTLQAYKSYVTNVYMGLRRRTNIKKDFSSCRICEHQRFK